MENTINATENQNQLLINITYDNDNDSPTVSGRELHEKLEIETRYNDWFKRMCEYGFEENEDYNLLKFEKVQKEGFREVKREIIDHELTIDMAKQICMIQRTDIGKTYREYFLEIERQWNSPEAVMARAIKMADKKINSLKSQVNILESENKLLAAQNLQWADRDFIDAAVRKYGYCECGAIYGKAWNTYKKELLYKYGINLNARITNYCKTTGKKTKPHTLDMIKDEELPNAISTIVSICKDANVNISDLILKIKN